MHRILSNTLMFSYQLDNREEDLLFLNRQVVRCTAAFTPDQIKQIRIGDKIVIQLSNRDKYLGRIINMNLESGMTSAGYLEIIRQ